MVMSPVHQVWRKTILQGTVKGGGGEKTRQTEEEVGRQHQEMDRPGVRQVPEGSGEQEKMEKNDCKIICGALTTLAVKGLMMLMMMMMMMMTAPCFTVKPLSNWSLVTVPLARRLRFAVYLS